jgi:hypothetical protein
MKKQNLETVGLSESCEPAVLLNSGTVTINEDGTGEVKIKSQQKRGARYSLYQVKVKSLYDKKNRVELEQTGGLFNTNIVVVLRRKEFKKLSKKFPDLLIK